MDTYTSGLLNGIIKARQRLLQDGHRFGSLSCRVHPRDYMTIGLEYKIGGIIGLNDDGALTVLEVPFVKDANILIGTTIVESSGK